MRAGSRAPFGSPTSKAWSPSTQYSQSPQPCSLAGPRRQAGPWRTGGWRCRRRTAPRCGGRRASDNSRASAGLGRASPASAAPSHCADLTCKFPCRRSPAGTWAQGLARGPGSSRRERCARAKACGWGGMFGWGRVRAHASQGPPPERQRGRVSALKSTRRPAAPPPRPPLTADRVALHQEHGGQGGAQGGAQVGAAQGAARGGPRPARQVCRGGNGGGGGGECSGAAVASRLCVRA